MRRNRLGAHSIAALLFDATADVAHLPLALLLVFGAAKILAEICERLGQPGIVGEILAGVLIGPSLLNWVQPDQVLLALAELGVMFLLFRVGLEVKASELMRVGPTALLVAILGVAIPFAVGCMIMTTVVLPGSKPSLSGHLSSQQASESQLRYSHLEVSFRSVRAR